MKKDIKQRALEIVDSNALCFLRTWRRDCHEKGAAKNSCSFFTSKITAGQGFLIIQMQWHRQSWDPQQEPMNRTNQNRLFQQLDI